MADCVTASTDSVIVTNIPISTNSPDLCSTVTDIAKNKKADKINESLYFCGEPKCSKIVPESGDSIFCDFCNKWFHLSCTEVDKDTFQFLTNTSQSIFWKCSICPSVEEILNMHHNFKNFEKNLTTKIDKIETNISKKINLAYKAKGGSSYSTSTSLLNATTVPPLSCTTTVLPRLDATTVSPSSSNKNIGKADISTKQANDKISNTTEKICNYYRMGICRHGASGKKLVNNRECIYRHPLKCKNYCRYGQEGCDGSCGHLHPILCRDSLNFRQCNNANCTFAHLQGTQRYYDKPHNYDDNRASTRKFRNSRNFNISNTSRQLAEKYYPNLSNKKDFLYDQNDFPPLVSNNNERMEEFSTAIHKLQGSINFLLHQNGAKNQINHNSFPKPYNLPHPHGWTHTLPYQQNQLDGNIQMYPPNHPNGHQQYGYPPKIAATSSQPVTNEQAKNYTTHSQGLNQ